jgi:hypothetical protein
MRGPVILEDTMRQRSLASLIALLMLVLMCQGCTQLVTYGKDRARDLSDVIDVRYGIGFGLGASAQLGELVQTGLGCSTESYQRQFFGRKSVVVRDGLFAAGVLVGFDGDYVRRLGADRWRVDGGVSTGTFSVLFFKVNTIAHPATSGDDTWFAEPGGDLPALELGRVGGAVFLPGVNAGLYFNLGEFADFLCGLAGFDLMHDDGHAKFFTPEPADIGT